MRMSITIMSLVVAVGTGPSAAGQHAVPVVVTKVQRKPIAATTELVATVRARRRSKVAAAVPGIVEKLLVREGQAIRKGDVIATLSRDLAVAALAAQKAKVDRSRAELDELRAGTRKEVILQAKAQWAEAVSMRDREQKRTARIRDRFEKGIETEEVLLDAQLVAERAKLNADRLKAAYDLAVEGPRSEAIRAAEARLAAESAELQRLRDNDEKRSIRAPFSGIVGRRSTEEGQWLGAGDAVCELVDLSKVEVVIPIPQRYIGAVTVGAAVQIRLDSAQDGEVMEGRIDRIAPAADEVVRTFPAYVVLDNPTGRLRAGISARASLACEAPRVALVVPQDCLFARGGAEFVCAVNDKNVVEYVFVQTGRRSRGLVEITGRVKEGLRVVVRGNERIYPGQKVAVTKATEKTAAPPKSDG